VGESVQQLDAVICCTGYNYHFPFLDLQVRVVEHLGLPCLGVLVLGTFLKLLQPSSVTHAVACS
jgi:hypothetical protein